MKTKIPEETKNMAFTLFIYGLLSLSLITGSIENDTFVLACLLTYIAHKIK